MIQVISKSTYQVLWTALGIWDSVLGGTHDVFASDTWGPGYTRVPLPIPGKFRKLTLYSAETRSLDVSGNFRKNDSATALSATIQTTDTLVTNPNDEVSCAAGDDVSFLWFAGLGASFGATGKDFGFSLEFEGTGSVFGLSGIRGGVGAGDCWGSGALGGSTAAFLGGLPADGADVGDYDLNALEGIIDKLCIKEVGSSASGGSWTAYIRKNRILQPNAVTLADGDGFEIGTINARCTLADRLQIIVRRNTTNAPSSNSEVAVGISFIPDINGAFMFSGGAIAGALDASTDHYTWGGSIPLTSGPGAGPISTKTFVAGLYAEMGNPITADSSWLARLTKSGLPTAAEVTFLPGSDGSELIDNLRIELDVSDYVEMLARPDASPVNLPLKWAIAAGIHPLSPVRRGNIGPIAWLKTSRVQP